MRESRVRNHRTVLTGRRKFTIVHCPRFWDHMFKITQNRKKLVWGVRKNSRSKIVHASGRSSKIHDRTLFTLLGPHC